MMRCSNRPDVPSLHTFAGPTPKPLGYPVLQISLRCDCLGSDFSALFHGVDERVPTDALGSASGYSSIF